MNGSMHAGSGRQVRERGDIGLLFLIILGSIAVCLLTLVLDWVKETKDNRGRVDSSLTYEQTKGPTAGEADRFSVVSQ